MVTKLPITAALRGYRRLTLALLVLALLPTVLLPVIIDIPVYNQHQPAVGALALILLAAVIVVSYHPRPITVLFAALLTAGAGANILLAQFTPVADYLLIPGSLDHYANLADVFIVGAMLIAPGVLKSLLSTNWPVTTRSKNIPE